jgi:N-acetylglutamate synthase-like GNAT family acetyltransferase
MSFLPRMRLRDAELEDLDEVVAMHAAMDREEKALGCVCIHPATRDFIESKLLDPATQFLVAEHDRKLVAFAYGTLLGDVLELQNVFVRPLWRRNGVARLLLTRLFSELRASSARTYILKGNIYESFWKSLGFRVARELVNAFEMEMELNGESRDVRIPKSLRLVR